MLGAALTVEAKIVVTRLSLWRLHNTIVDDSVTMPGLHSRLVTDARLYEAYPRDRPRPSSFTFLPLHLFQFSRNARRTGITVLEFLFAFAISTAIITLTVRRVGSLSFPR